MKSEGAVHFNHLSPALYSFWFWYCALLEIYNKP